MEKYSEELPKRFATWVEFYDKAIQQNLVAGYETIIYIEEPKINAVASKSIFPNVPKQKEVRFKISTIKENALEELLAERLTKYEADRFLVNVGRALAYCGRNELEERNDFVEKQFSKVKRILLTQCRK